VTEIDRDGSATSTTTPLAEHHEESFEISFKPLDEERARQYDSDAADLVAYLVFMTDPSASTRSHLGVWVLLFIGVFAIAAWRLNRVYWRDVH
jgi:ubiquinol-cytochrome c reductase cytochrome c1 subunit